MSVATSILAAVKTALEGISGLSVVRGRPNSLTEGPSGPCAWVAAGDLTSDHGPELTGYNQTLLVDVVAVVTAASDFGDREDAVLTLADQVAEAIQTSTTLAALLSVAPIVGQRVQAEAVGLPGYAVLVTVIQCQWLSDSGSGL